MIETTRITGTIRSASQWRLVTIAGLVVVALAAVGTPAGGQSFAPTSNWLTGDARVTAAGYETTIAWADAPLRERLTSLARHQRIAIFLDRRVDPGSIVTIRKSGVTFNQFLWSLAGQLNLDVCLIGDVYYVGPVETARCLPAVADRAREQIRSMPARERPVTVDLPEISWPHLTEPQKLLRQTCADAGLGRSFEVDHDLWAAGGLPQMHFADRLTLLLAGFDLAADLHQQTTQRLSSIEPVDEADRGSHLLHQSDDAKSLLKAARKEFADVAKLGRRGTSIIGSADAATLARIRRWLVEQETPVKRPMDQNTFTINDTTATRLQILRTVAGSLQRELQFSPEHETLLQQRMTLNVTNVSVEDLFAAILVGTGLSADLDVPGVAAIR